MPGGAFCNMLRAVARDPVWALSAAVLSLIHAGRYLLATLLIGAVALFVLALAANWITSRQGFKAGSPVHVALTLGAVVIAVLVVLRRATAPIIRHFSDLGSDTHGSARFASASEVRRLTRARDGLLIGRDLSGRLLRYSGGSHLMTVAPTRTGKGVGTLIPNLLTVRSSVICIDPKGENTRVTRRARAQMGPVHVLDPFAVTGWPSAAFNPLADLDPASSDLAEDVATLADALVYDPPAEAHWNEEAKALTPGSCCTSSLRSRRNGDPGAAARTSNLSPISF